MEHFLTDKQIFKLNPPETTVLNDETRITDGTYK